MKGKNIVDVHPTSPIENRVILLLLIDTSSTKVYTARVFRTYLQTTPTWSINTPRLIQTGDFEILLYSRITQQHRNLRLKTHVMGLYNININVQYTTIYTYSMVVHVYSGGLVHNDENNIRVS